MHLVERPNGTFTNQEFARLAAYRAAVAAGFYTDWDGTEETTDVAFWAALNAAGVAGEDERNPFTAEERQRLEECRARLQAGGYTEDLPPRAEGTDKQGQDALS
jgi:hypothetical protein